GAAARLTTIPRTNVLNRVRGRATLHRTEGARIAPGQDPHQLVVEIVRVVPHVARDAVGVHLPSALDVFLEPLVDVLVPPPFVHLGFIVELDLAHDEPGETLGLFVGLLVLRRERARGGRGHRPGAGRGCTRTRRQLLLHPRERGGVEHHGGRALAVVGGGGLGGRGRGPRHPRALADVLSARAYGGGAVRG